MFTASWDKMVRIVDLETNKVTKSFVASKEAIKTMLVTDKYIFVAGCDPIIRGFSLETGECKMYQGHEGWIYCLEVFEGKLFSGGDDRTIKIWDIETTNMLEELNAHESVHVKQETHEEKSGGSKLKAPAKDSLGKDSAL